MGGYMARGKPSTGVHDKITCRALWLQITGNKVLLVEADFVGLEKKRVETLKQQIHEKHKIPTNRILIGVTHPHSSVLNINLFTTPSDIIKDQVDEGILLAVDRAVSGKFEGYMEGFKGIITDVSFNRRDWDPLSDIVNDEIVGAKIFDSKDKLKGVFYNYSCHPVVMGADNLQLSADWPYFTQQSLRSHYNDPDLFVMFLQGTPGNLNPVNTPMNGVIPPHTFVECQEIGEKLGTQLAKILDGYGFPIGQGSSAGFLKIMGVVKDIKIPMDDEDKAEFFEEFAEIVQEEGQPMVSTVVQGIRFGPLGIVGLPGEIFSEIAVNLKKQAQLPLLMVVGYANDYIGYAGPKAVYEAGGYEMAMMGLSPEEGPIIEEAGIKVVDFMNQLPENHRDSVCF